ncbi:hypothetical protein MMC25_005523 [Agyrium rufum]|nr:hypothetical protein [Agyrium rufum]
MAEPCKVPDEPGQPPALTVSALASVAPAESTNAATTTRSDETTTLSTPTGLPILTRIKEQIITPFDVSGGTDESGKLVAIDYNKLIATFGSKPIDAALLERFEKVTGQKPHRLMRRGMVFSHRDFNLILDKYEKGIPFYLYTGRGPSSDSMHVGHTIPFEFTKWLQEVFNVPLVIMLTDDEKFYHTPRLTLEECRRFAHQNAMDIIAVGFDIKKTFIFIDTEFLASGSNAAFNSNMQTLGKRTTMNQIKGTFGFGDSNNIAEFAFPAMQSATAFASSFPFIFGADRKRTAKIPCLIPCAIDQDPYFRQCRDNAQQMGYVKPALIHSVFLPSLKGAETKMSASDIESSIYLSDTEKQIQKKVGNAFSGGQDTRELHREFGGRTEVDIPFQYLRFFLEDDERLEEIRLAYESGKMETGEIKKICTGVVQEYVRGFRERRAQVTKDVLAEFLRPRPLTFKGAPKTDVKDVRRRLDERKTEMEELERLLREVETSTSMADSAPSPAPAAAA